MEQEWARWMVAGLGGSRPGYLDVLKRRGGRVKYNNLKQGTVVIIFPVPSTRVSRILGPTSYSCKSVGVVTTVM